jgi:acyl carrier protein
MKIARDVAAMADADLLERVRALVAEMSCVRLDRLRPETRLEEDLGITGDDAAELLQAFAERFGVDMTGLSFHKHFGPEGCNPLWFFYTPTWLRAHGSYPVTIDHLVRVAEIKRWYSPPFD